MEGKKHSIKYELFIKKLQLIRFYRDKHISYENIAYIMHSDSRIIKMYDYALLKKGEEYNE